MYCQGFDKKGENCRLKVDDGKKFCNRNHSYLEDYTQEMIDNSKKCSSCRNTKIINNGKICDDCKLDSKKKYANRKESVLSKQRELYNKRKEEYSKDKIICKKDECNLEAKENGYCYNHRLHEWVDTVIAKGMKPCCNYNNNGCRSELLSTYKWSQCEDCRTKNKKEQMPDMEKIQKINIKKLEKIQKQINLNIQNSIDVTYDSKNYVVIKILYKDEPKYVVIDKDKANIVYNYKWMSIDGEYIVTDIEGNLVYIHRLLMDKIDFTDKQTIDHINRITTDNRLENLRIATQEQQNLNQKAKVRKDLPKDADIKKEDLPKDVGYVPSDGKHGERLYIDINNVPGYGRFRKYTTSSRKKPLSYKLEEAKKILNNLKLKYPGFDDLNIQYNMNEKSIKLIKSYNEILKLTGIPNVEKYLVEEPNIVDKILKDDEQLNIIEQDTLEKTDLLNKNNKNVANELPVGCGVTLNMIPSHCYYTKVTKERGDRFTIDRRNPKPTLLKSSTSKRSMTTLEKFNEFMEILRILENDPTKKYKISYNKNE